MTWSALDVAVVVLFLAQLIGWGFVFSALLKLKTGQVDQARQRVMPLVAGAKTLAEAIPPRALSLKRQILRLVARTQTIRKRLDVTTPPEGMWIEPRHVQHALGLAQMVRQRRRGAVPTARKQRGKKSLAVRLGLVPPVLVRLAPLGKVARVALQTLQQLRR